MAVLRRVGLAATGLDEIEHEVVGSLNAYRTRLGHRAISTFEYLTADEIDHGLAPLAADAAAETQPQPVRHVQDLVS